MAFYLHSFAPFCSSLFVGRLLDLAHADAPTPLPWTFECGGTGTRAWPSPSPLVQDTPRAWLSPQPLMQVAKIAGNHVRHHRSSRASCSPFEAAVTAARANRREQSCQGYIQIVCRDFPTRPIYEDAWLMIWFRFSVGYNVCFNARPGPSAWSVVSKFLFVYECIRFCFSFSSCTCMETKVLERSFQ